MPSARPRETLKPVDLPPIPLPQHWDEHSKRGILAAFSLAHYVVTAIRAWGHNVVAPPVHEDLRVERLEARCAWLAEQLRIVQSRWDKVPPHNRPRYSNDARFAILKLKEACGWSIGRTAREFHLSRQTIAHWIHLLDDDRLVAPPRPVNRFPDYVTVLVHSLKLAFPMLGYKAIADWLARAGLHLAVTTIRRLLQQPLRRRPRTPPLRPQNSSKPEPPRTVTARYPGHVWNIDLTTVPTSLGLALSWCPFAFPPVFPFAYKVVAVVDHFSRCLLACRAFIKEPSGEEVAGVLEDAVAKEGTAPRYTVSDKGSQFFNVKAKKPAAAFQDWIHRHGVQPRFGAVGRKGSIAVIERFFRTLKTEGIRRILVPYRLDELQAELNVFADWYNTMRPHSALGGACPNDVHHGRPPPPNGRGSR